MCVVRAARQCITEARFTLKARTFLLLSLSGSHSLKKLHTEKRGIIDSQGAGF